MLNKNTIIKLMSTKEEVKAKVLEWFGDTHCFVEMNGSRYNAVYQPILNELYINDLGDT